MTGDQGWDTNPYGTWDTTPITVDGTQGWDSARVAIRGQNYCPWMMTFLDPKTGNVFDYGNPCRSFTHRPCAEKRVEKLLEHLGGVVFPFEEWIWVAGGEYDEGLGNRMGVRRNKVKVESGETVNASWVRRTSGTFFYFATAELKGDKTPVSGEWLKNDDAFTVARLALLLPGIGDHDGRKGINGKWWRLPPDDPKELVRLAQKEPLANVIRTETERRLGFGPPYVPRLLFRGELDEVDRDRLDRWNEMVERVADEMNEIRRGN